MTSALRFTSVLGDKMPARAENQAGAISAALFASLIALSSSANAGQDSVAPRLLSVKRLWDQAEHSAFTDLLFHEERWYCVFREGSRHVSADGALRVLGSEDGEKWESLALITHPQEDLRDAKLCVTPDGRLMLNGAGMRAQEKIRHRSMVWFSEDKGQTWSEGKSVGDPGYWLWRMQWHQGKAYSFGYSTRRDRRTRDLHLYRSEDGEHFERWVDGVDTPPGVGEDAILFDAPLGGDSGGHAGGDSGNHSGSHPGEGGTALCLMRREAGSKSSILGRSEPPYTRWSWQDVGFHLGGPNMIRLPDGRIIAAGRLYEPEYRTSLLWLDPRSSTLTEFLQLPSGGDTSYPGLVLRDNILWVSYYSSHEGKASIYLAKVQVGPNKS